LVHAQLAPGEENSGKLVSMVRQQATMLAVERKADWVLVDGAPGIGCTVIAAVAGADLALLVVEPTLSGIHDLERVLGVCEHFQVASALVINKADLNADLVEEIHALADAHGLRVLAEIPYSDLVTECMRQACAVTELEPNGPAKAMRSLRAELSKL
jgi:MinD superfamily P-loop ATPase